jgi:ribosome-binding protein aMBF1 (putative translation factor)
MTDSLWLKITDGLDDNVEVFDIIADLGRKGQPRPIARCYRNVEASQVREALRKYLDCRPGNTESECRHLVRIRLIEAELMNFTLGDLMREARRKKPGQKKISQRKAAKMLRIPVNLLQDIEYGKYDPRKTVKRGVKARELLLSIAEVLHIEKRKIMKGVEKVDNKT